jgi:hypothetical protein
MYKNTSIAEKFKKKKISATLWYYLGFWETNKTQKKLDEWINKKQ